MEQSDLETYRASVDNLDAALVYLLAERFRVTHAIGRLKQREALPAEDRAREQDQIERLKALALAAGLDPAVVETVFPVITAEVRRRHEVLRAPPR